MPTSTAGHSNTSSGEVLTWVLRSTGGDASTHFVAWTPAGGHILFNQGTAIWRVDAGGAVLHRMVDTNVDLSVTNRPVGEITLWSRFGHYGTISPDGRSLVYGTCRFPDEALASAIRTPIPDFARSWADYAAWEGWEAFQYEIASLDLQSGEETRLTTNWFFDLVPVWSPDGSRIAFMTNDVTTNPIYPPYQVSKMRLATMSPDGSDVVTVVDAFPETNIGLFELFAPTWSPDGERLAFLTLVHGSDHTLPEKDRNTVKLHTVRADGSGLMEIGEATAPGAWSPDGGRLAFATIAEAAVEDTVFGQRLVGSVVIHTAKADGTGREELWRSEEGVPFTKITHLAWSPDGAELLVVSDGVYVLGADGGAFRRVFRHKSADPAVIPAPVVAAWSPDGDRIALYVPSETCDLDPWCYRNIDALGQVLVLERNGTDLRVLVETVEGEGQQAKLQVVHAVPEDQSDDANSLRSPTPP